MERILVTPRSLSTGNHPSLAPLRAAGYELVIPTPGAIPGTADLARALPGCVGWLAGVERVGPVALAAADRLRVISRYGTGIDNLPLELLQARGIAVRRVEGAMARSVAELALALLLAGMRQIVPIHEAMRRGEWSRPMGREIAGASVAVIGLGAIGATVARMCLNLGAHVRGFDPAAPEDRVAHQNFRRLDFDAAVAGAHAVTLHAPAPDEAGPIIDRAVLDSLAEGAVLVNTARARLVDEEAVVAALENGGLSTYATDVYMREPPVASALLAHPQVTQTSHIGSYTSTASARTAAAAIDNLLSALTTSAIA